MIDRALLSKRLNNAYDYLYRTGSVHNVAEFAKLLGKDRANVTNALACKGRVMTQKLLERVADTFPDILSRDYLLTGQGDVAAPDRSMRPHFEATARAGFMTGLSNPEAGSLRHRHDDIPDYDFTITAEGDSMMPEIKSGDILFCRHSRDRANPPISKVCVLDGKDGAVVKVIRTADSDTVTLHSLNPDYKDYTVPLADILGIAEVVALIRPL